MEELSIYDVRKLHQEGSISDLLEVSYSGDAVIPGTTLENGYNVLAVSLNYNNMDGDDDCEAPSRKSFWFGKTTLEDVDAFGWEVTPEDQEYCSYANSYDSAWGKKPTVGSGATSMCFEASDPQDGGRSTMRIGDQTLIPPARTWAVYDLTLVMTSAPPPSPPPLFEEQDGQCIGLPEGDHGDFTQINNGDYFRMPRARLWIDENGFQKDYDQMSILEIRRLHQSGQIFMTGEGNAVADGYRDLTNNPTLYDRRDYLAVDQWETYVTGACSNNVGSRRMRMGLAVPYQDPDFFETTLCEPNFKSSLRRVDKYFCGFDNDQLMEDGQYTTQTGLIQPWGKNRLFLPSDASKTVTFGFLVELPRSRSSDVIS